MVRTILKKLTALFECSA